MPNAAPPERLTLDRLATPVGEAVFVADEAGALRAFGWDEQQGWMARRMARDYPGVEIAEAPAPGGLRDKIIAYFDGELVALDAIACAGAGTPFQESVWAALRTIPAGQTLSYGALAARIGQPKAMRAVGLANGQNPIGVVVPCHRVIGADGSLTGYGGGLERKRWLLEHEGVLPRSLLIAS
jgi:methylated-DNA-[protein]-cysteine S-methyltransferase